VFGVRVVPTAAQCPLPLAAASKLDPDLFVVIPVRCGDAASLVQAAVPSSALCWRSATAGPRCGTTPDRPSACIRQVRYISPPAAFSVLPPGESLGVHARRDRQTDGRTEARQSGVFVDGRQVARASRNTNIHETCHLPLVMCLLLNLLNI